MKRVSSGLEGRGHQVLKDHLFADDNIDDYGDGDSDDYGDDSGGDYCDSSGGGDLHHENSRLGALSLRSGAPSPDTLGEPH